MSDAGGKFEFSTKLLYRFCLALICIAVAAPIAAALGVLKPEAVHTAAWLQRSAAISTVFSLLEFEAAAFALGRLYMPGTYGDVDKLATYAAYVPRFNVLRYWAVGITVLGTLLWGYGDLLPLP